MFESIDKIELSPSGLCKKIVGEEMLVSLRLSPMYQFNVELYTNVNYQTDYYPMELLGGKYTISLRLVSSGFFWYKIRFKREGAKNWKWVRIKPYVMFEGKVQVDPSWINEAVLYNVFVRFFHGTRHNEPVRLPGSGGTFDDVKTHLYKLKKMGIDTLYFNPIHPIGELYRKVSSNNNLPPYFQPGSPYSIKDYKAIDPELAYDRDSNKHLLAEPAQEWRDLINTAHELDMKIIMDLVFNHTAHDFVYQRMRPEWYLYKMNCTSVDDPYIYPDEINQGKPWGNAANTVSPYDHEMWFDDVAQLNWEYKNPPAPNNPPPNSSIKEMWTFFKSIPQYWIKNFNIDGFRCDIAYMVPPDFWKACILEAKMCAKNSHNLTHDVIFLAEAFTNDLDLLQEAGFTAVYGDFSNKLNKAADLYGYLDYIYNRSGNYFPSGSKWVLFPEVHDFDRAAKKMLDEQDINFDNASRVNKSRWVLSALLPGLPLIFNGFEKVEWKQVDLFSYGAVDWDKHVDLSEFITKINWIRKGNSAFLMESDYIPVYSESDNSSSQLFAFVRKSIDQIALVAVNLDIKNNTGFVKLKLTEDFFGNYVLHELLSDVEYQRSGDVIEVGLAPGESQIFILKNIK